MAMKDEAVTEIITGSECYNVVSSPFSHDSRTARQAIDALLDMERKITPFLKA
jgi:hypothetical protein